MTLEAAIAIIEVVRDILGYRHLRTWYRSFQSVEADRNTQDSRLTAGGKFKAPVRRGGFMTSNDSKFEKVQTDFQALSVVASSLNSASDELTKVVGILDAALQKLNIGLSAWINYTNRETEQPDEIDEDQIGYCKINGKWGIGLRRVWGNVQTDFYDYEGPWLFNDSPREMRLNSVDKIPELIAALNKTASEMTKKVQEKTQGVRELAGVIEQIASPEKRGLKPRPSDAYAEHVRLLEEQAKSLASNPSKQSTGLPPPPIPAIAADDPWPAISELAKSAPLSSLAGKKKEGGK